ncbi:MAG: hypothetical protein KatS3mg119_0313 [Rhodothalassiaceae bacterium]|nr:MAG: hypothetical protein KatS3mg119_0313 [Rhodothalassiaceae bacterium]
MCERRPVEWFALRALLARRAPRGRPWPPRAVLIYQPDRLGREGLAMLARLPREVAVLYRGYGRPQPDPLLDDLAHACRRQRRLLWVAGEGIRPRRLPPGVAGRHLAAWQMRRPAVAARPGARPRLLSGAVHDGREGRLVRRLVLPWALVSPVFATASHPGARAMGPHVFARFCRRLRGAGGPRHILALGGMTARRLRRLAGAADGFAAIGFWEHLAGSPQGRLSDRDAPGGRGTAAAARDDARRTHDRGR